MGLRRSLVSTSEELWNDTQGRGVMLVGGAVVLAFLVQLYCISVSKSLVLSTCAWLLLFGLTTLGAALLSLSVAKAGPSRAYSYGRGRAPVLAVFASTVLATLAAIFVIKESLERLIEGEEHVAAAQLPFGCLATSLGLLLATYGVKNEPLTHVLTASSSSWLQEHSADAANALCTLVPGLSRFLLPRLNPLSILNAAATLTCLTTYYLMAAGGFWWADSAGALVLCLAIMGSMVPLAKYTGRILLQTSPPHLVGQLERCLREAERLDGVLELTNAHFWQLDFRRMTGTVTVRIRRDADEQAVLTRVTEKLFSLVQNLTVQVVKDTDWRSVSGGAPVSQFLSAPPPVAASAHGHAHDEGHGHAHGPSPEAAHGHSHEGGHGHSHSEVMHH